MYENDDEQYSQWTNEYYRFQQAARAPAGLPGSSDGLRFPNPQRQSNAGPGENCVRPRPQAFRGDNQSIYSYPTPQQSMPTPSPPSPSPLPSYSGYNQEYASYSQSYSQSYSYSYNQSQAQPYASSSSTSYHYSYGQPSSTPYYLNDPYYQGHYPYANSYYAPAAAPPATAMGPEPPYYNYQPPEVNETSSTMAKAKANAMSDEDDFDLEDVEEVDFAKNYASPRSGSASSTPQSTPSRLACIGAEEVESDRVQRRNETTPVSKAPQFHVTVPEPTSRLEEILSPDSIARPRKPGPKSATSAIFSLALNSRNAKRKRPRNETEDDLTQLLGKAKRLVSSRSYAARPSPTKRPDDELVGDAEKVMETCSDTASSVDGGSSSTSRSQSSQFRSECSSEYSCPPSTRAHTPVPSDKQNENVGLDSPQHVSANEMEDEDDQPVFDIRIRNDIFEDEEDSDDDISAKNNAEDEELEIV